MAARSRTPKHRTPSRRPAQHESGWRLRDEEVERLLRTGERRGLLEEYFGEAEYAELRELARSASLRGVRGGPRVLILPGIMGSKLGRTRARLPDDVLWLDPLDVLRGRLLRLALPGGADYRALGVMLFAYLKLLLRLRIAGFDADFHPYDWRRSLVELGAELARRVAAEPAPAVHLVAHSMGGLVARAALARERRLKLGRLVMLGTPNFGSFAPVQALRGSYAVVRKLAALARTDAAALAEKVFKTLPGLHEMLPFPERFDRVDLYDASRWPTDAPVPTQRRLDAVAAVQRALAAPDERFRLIAGVGQETTVGLALDNESFRYELGPEGDGTVPLAFAELPGVPTWYVEETHGSLPNHGSVGAAVVELLHAGETSQLPRRFDRRRARARRSVPEAALRVPPFDGRRGNELSLAERRCVIAELAAPAARRAAAGAPEPSAPRPHAVAAAGPGLPDSLRNVEVGRRRARSLELCLARGSITEVKARALVLGLFREVEPAGAAAAVDARLDGAIREFTARRMFSAEVGEIFAMPTGRHLIYADNVLFVGLGAFDRFGPEVQEFAAENVVRACARTCVEDFASVLVGGATGFGVAQVVQHQLRGYLRGMLDAERGHVLRRITLCELDAERFQAMKEEVYRLAGTELFADVEVGFDEIRLPDPAPDPAPADAAHTRARVSGETGVAYLWMREETSGRHASVLRASLLTGGGKATVLSESREVARASLDEHLRRIEAPSFRADRLRGFGEKLAELVLGPGIAQALKAVRAQPLVVVHDAATSRIPWETLCVRGWFPAAEAGLSRRYAAENLSVAKWLEQRRVDATLDVLLVANPTGDLPGADAEADRILALFPRQSAVRVHELRGAQATRPALLAEFQSGRYDVIHYAGHAFFDAEDRARSGILCHGEQVLSGAQLAGISGLPALLFFNACEAARVRGRARVRPARAPRRAALRERILRNVGLAEAFLRGGAANYVGTTWPVEDAAASAFAARFYAALVGGESIGAALQHGRRALRRMGSLDWADYVHYGVHDFALKHATEGQERRGAPLR